MTQAAVKNELHNALELLETSLVTPLVPGELVAWSESLQAACEEAHACWLAAATFEHPSQYKQIRREDPEMNSRVESLQREDGEITSQFDAVRQAVVSFQRRSATMQEDEARFEEVRLRMVDEGLKLVIRIRAQAQALRVWFVEAFDRDRGNAD